MSFEAMAWAVKQKCATTGQKMVLLMMANYANDDGVCWPKKQTLADACCMSKSAVCDNINRLKDVGLITVDERGGEPGEGRQKSSIITLHMGPASGQQAAEVSGNRTAGVQNSDTSGVRLSDSHKNLSKDNLSIEPITPSADADLEADFEEFWAAYPKRPNNPRKAAMKAYKRVRKNLHVSQKHLLNKLREYSSYMEGEQAKFIAMASTWLNDERYNCDFQRDAETRKGYRAVNREVSGLAAPELTDGDVGNLINIFPGVSGGGIAMVRATLHLVGVEDFPQIVEAVKKYAILVKQKRAEGWPVEPPTLVNFIKFRWRDMEAYEFCRVGMEMKEAVRHKKVAA